MPVWLLYTRTKQKQKKPQENIKQKTKSHVSGNRSDNIFLSLTSPYSRMHINIFLIKQKEEGK